MMNILYKYFLISCLILLTLPAFAKPNYSYTINQTPIQTQYNTQGVYVNEEITTPITQIGLPEEYTQPEIVEQGLEIVWNEWHANTRNQMLRNIKGSSLPKNFLIELLYTVDINKNISNIVAIYVPKNAILKINNTAYLDQNSVFYLYQYESNKFYKLSYLSDPIRIATDCIDKILNNSSKTQISFGQVPYWVTFPKLGERIKKFSGNKHLTFPIQTHRTSVVVKQGFTDIDYLKGGDYKSTDFNDIEKQ